MEEFDFALFEYITSDWNKVFYKIVQDNNGDNDLIVLIEAH